MFVSFSSVSSTPGPLAARALAALPTNDALALGVALGASRPAPGRGATADLWEALATLGAHDLGVVRAIEPHLDAVAILSQAGVDRIEGCWGVFAAEGGDDPLVAAEGNDWSLSGTKPWCSLASQLDSALVTAADTGGQRRLFAVSLAHPGVRVEQGAWAARGLTEIPSGPVHFDAVPATPVGGAGWYLERPGFAWGGIGVAACWYGGAVGIGRTVFDAATRRADPFLYGQLGAIDEQLQSCRRALAEAVLLVDASGVDGGGVDASGADGGGVDASGVDGGRADASGVDGSGADEGGVDEGAAVGGRVDPRLLAKRVRATVARACEEIIGRAGHALGPAPLALDAEHAKRVADLQLYVRQHHGEKDQASLGEALTAGDVPW